MQEMSIPTRYQTLLLLSSITFVIMTVNKHIPEDHPGVIIRHCHLTSHIASDDTLTSNVFERELSKSLDHNFALEVVQQFES